MTFCSAIKIPDGIVGLADTRVTTGVERITAKKVSIIRIGDYNMFLMTSGLRSARDKSLTYFYEYLEEHDQPFDKLYQAVDILAQQVRRVRNEDTESLKESGLYFNLNCIIGGRLAKDKDHKLYLLYPQANWVEVAESTPYFLIGESSYGKPLFERALPFLDNIETCMKISYLAFDATRRAATDVDFPLDVVIFHKDGRIQTHRFEQEDVMHVSRWWEGRLAKAMDELPSDWISQALNGGA